MPEEKLLFMDIVHVSLCSTTNQAQLLASCLCDPLPIICPFTHCAVGGGGGGGGGGELHLKPPKFDRNLNTHLSCHNFFPLSSLQILLIPACSLLCVL